MVSIQENPDDPDTIVSDNEKGILVDTLSASKQAADALQGDGFFWSDYNLVSALPTGSGGSGFGGNGDSGRGGGPGEVSLKRVQRHSHYYIESGDLFILVYPSRISSQLSHRLF